MAAPIPNGPYGIAKRGEQLLTLNDSKAPAVVLPPTGQPGEQEWHVESLSNGNVTIKNLRHETYLSFDGVPEINKMLRGSSQATEWQLRQSAAPQTFHVVVPGGPVDGVELAVDLSLLRIFPPMTALRPLEPERLDQAWRFEFHE
ncbi:hypothetical protein GCM10018781_46100 [Kitasatospora indigofera]|uniref:Ricin B lectin domain-containing protein n=1 Tax=Kitasatospora indigofera TaxID=67307 RepID=A0A919G1K5_9ACTN|nr:hypothetical protein [Kitasatospora indigofera]GHH75963.1 hypothetical protein GCM10018781_46100 [Kitasatospora indigofera]